VVVYFTKGAKIERLPGAAILNPVKAGKPQRVANIKITLNSVTYIVRFLFCVAVSLGFWPCH
jgi:hypothetical protein